MKNKTIMGFLATISAMVWIGLPAGVHAAVDPDELAEIRRQLETLTDRVDRLEEENTRLKTENDALKVQGDYLRAETRGLRKDSAQHAAEVSKVKGADWAGRIAIKGDMRYRHEQISNEALNAAGVQATADRYRDRIRARVALEAKATETLRVGIGLTTTEGSDPRSGNQSLDDVFSRKSLDLDLAYIDWQFAGWGELIGGKMKQPFVKAGGQGHFWDNDINPEGLAVAVERGMWFGSAYNYWINEVSGSRTALTADAMVRGAQVGLQFPLGASTLTTGVHYYDLSAGQGRRGVFFDCSDTSDGCANGNTVIGPAGSGVLAHDFQVIELFADYQTSVGELPVQVWADVAENQDPDDLNLAWALGLRLGAASGSRTWEIGAAYQTLEKDALFAQLIDSDFAGGVTDSKGWVLRAGYAPVRNWLLNATYFMNELNVDVPNATGQRNVDYDRLQLDFNVKF